MNKNNRTEERLPLQNECILYNRFGFIKTQAVDISKMGLGVEVDRIPQFEIGCELAVVIPSMDKSFLAELIWTKKDNNTTSLGLKFIPSK